MFIWLYFICLSTWVTSWFLHALKLSRNISHCYILCSFILSTLSLDANTGYWGLWLIHCDCCILWPRRMNISLFIHSSVDDVGCSSLSVSLFFCNYKQCFNEHYALLWKNFSLLGGKYWSEAFSPCSHSWHTARYSSGWLCLLIAQYIF